MPSAPWDDAAAAEVLAALHAVIWMPDHLTVARARKALAVVERWGTLPWDIAEDVRAARMTIESWERHVEGT